MTDADLAVSAIEATQNKEVAVIEATQASNAEEASAFMTTLDKLESFKRYSLALAFLFIFGGAIALFGIIIAVLVWKGQFDQAVDAAKWMITVIGTSVGMILGFYFGSNAIQSEKVP